MGRFDGKVAVVTGAGRGIGRSEALLLASEGAAVVVNDVGAALTGEGSEQRPAQEVVDLVTGAGGRAAANFDDITTWKGGESLIAQAVDTFGGIDVLVNNAGILRDRMSFNMSEEEWDAVINVHLKGHFVPTRHAISYWRAQSKERGEPVAASVINTSSEAGLHAGAGQLNYGAAKAGIAAMAIILARECEKFGVRVNAIAPRARTRMTEFMMGAEAPKEGFDDMAVEHVAALVGWLASDLSRPVTGQVFVVFGGLIKVMQGWSSAGQITSDKPWTIDDIEGLRDTLFAARDPGVPPFLPT
jgi:NAD(P)-dependent dehydrogenase (short-subunit alcohol dehydrogenase family)